MNSPSDLAKFIAKRMTDTAVLENTKIYELTGQRKYSSIDVADTFSKLLDKAVTVKSIPKEQWKETLLLAGFTENTAANLSDMTQCVIDNKTFPERPEDTIKLPTTLEKYLEEQLKR